MRGRPAALPGLSLLLRRLLLLPGLTRPGALPPAAARRRSQLLQMLSPGKEVRKLGTERRMTFTDEMKDLCGRKELEWADQPGTACLYTCGMMFAKSKPQCFCFLLDDAKLKEEKERGKAEGVAYVSTNDVLTSGFFVATGARIGMMGMDVRGRLPGVEADMAGNYVTALTMDETTFGSPGAVRKMLSKEPFATTNKPLPSCFGWMCGQDSAAFAMASNWSSFAGDLLQLEGCELELHMPVKNPAYCVYDLMVPFACAPGKVAMLCWVVNSDEKGLRKALPLGESISPDMFPVGPLKATKRTAN